MDLSELMLSIFEMRRTAYEKYAERYEGDPATLQTAWRGLNLLSAEAYATAGEEGSAMDRLPKLQAIQWVLQELSREDAPKGNFLAATARAAG